MMFRMAMVFAIVVLLVPQETNLGLGQPQAFAQLPAVSQFRLAAVDRLIDVRAQIEAVRHRPSITRLGLASYRRATGSF